MHSPLSLLVTIIYLVTAVLSAPLTAYAEDLPVAESSETLAQPTESAPAEIVESSTPDTPEPASDTSSSEAPDTTTTTENTATTTETVETTDTTTADTATSTADITTTESITEDTADMGTIDTTAVTPAAEAADTAQTPEANTTSETPGLDSISSAAVLVEEAPAAAPVDQVGSFTRAEALHLAQRALLDPTPADVDALLATGSRAEAVNLLFTPPSAEALTAYQNAVTAFAANGSVGNSTFMENYYTFRIFHDPFRAKRALWLVWEDTFSANPMSDAHDITYADVDNHHQFLYDNTLGDYRTLVQGMLSSYTMGRYLDLLGSPANRPNQNFARELLQLFLMEERPPLAPVTQERNYSEDDVAALSYILTGYDVVPGTRTVAYDPSKHNATPRTFLGSEQSDPQQIVQYIFDQRADQIAHFISAKLIRFYATDAFTQSDLDTIAQRFIAHNWNIEATVKDLLTSDFFYSTSVMHDVRFKNPVALAASAHRALYQGVPAAYQPENNLLKELGWTPYFPGSIFGRRGMDSNRAWMNAYTINQWVSRAMRTAFYSPSSTTPWSPTTLVPWLGTEAGATKTADDLLADLTAKLLLGNTLPSDVQTMLKTHLGTFSGAAPDIPKIRSLIGLILTQPEFVLQSGVSTSLATVTQNATSKYPDASPVVYLKLNGGFDWMGLVAPVSDPSYATMRGPLALTPDRQIALDAGYAMNTAGSPYKKYYDSGELTLINAVGLKNHSQSHEYALTQMETAGAIELGAVAAAFQGESPASTDLVSLYSGTPELFMGAPSLAIGSSSIQFRNTLDSSSALSFQTASAILSSRQYPGTLGANFTQAVKLDTVADQNVAKGGGASPGNTNSKQLQFVQQLMQNGIGKNYYLLSNGGYDFHSDETTGYDTRVNTLANDLSTFFDAVKASGQKVTIVVYSEFGRTNRTNGSNGTDHGTGGGMLLLSNVVDLPQMIGTLSPSTDTRNWITPRIDARSVWGYLLQQHFGVTRPFGQLPALTDYISPTQPEPVRVEQVATSTASTTLTFHVSGTVFDATSQGLSQAVFRYGTAPDALTRTATATLENSTYTVPLTALIPGTTYYFSIQLTDNLGTATVYTGTLLLPRSVDPARIDPLTQLPAPILTGGTTTGDLLLTGLANQSGEAAITLAGDTPETLMRTQSAATTITFPAGSRITRITAQGGASWTGDFLAPFTFTPARFFTADTISVGTTTLPRSSVLQIIKAGASASGVSLAFSAPATIVSQLPVPVTSGKVDIYSSEDGENWIPLHSDFPTTQTLSFTTPHLTYFMIVERGATVTLPQDTSVTTAPFAGGGTATSTPASLAQVLAENPRDEFDFMTPVSLAGLAGTLPKKVTISTEDGTSISFDAGTSITTALTPYEGTLILPTEAPAQAIPPTLCPQNVITMVTFGSATTPLTTTPAAHLTINLAAFAGGDAMQYATPPETWTLVTKEGAIVDTMHYDPDTYTMTADTDTLGSFAVVQRNSPSCDMPQTPIDMQATASATKIRRGLPTITDFTATHRPISRAEAVTLSARAFDLPLARGGAYLADVPRHEWYAPYARSAVLLGAMRTYSGDHFAPTRAMTTAEALTLVAKTAQLPLPSACTSYPDVPTGIWYAPIACLAKNEAWITTEYLNPGLPIAKESFKHVLEKAAITREKNAMHLVPYPGRQAPILLPSDLLSPAELTDFTAPLTLGSRGAEVIQLKKILTLTGDYEGTYTDDTFDATLADALTRYQLRNGLIENSESQDAGTLSATTRKSLNDWQSTLLN